MKAKIYLLLCVLLLSSCSKLSLAVYWADTFLLAQIDDYFTLTSEQKSEVKKQLQDIFREIRREEFPQLAAMLESMAAAIETGAVSAKEASGWSLSLRDRLIAMGIRFEPLGQKLIEWESQKGFRRFDQAFADKQQERFAKISSEERRQKEARKRAERMIDRTVEELTDSQESGLASLLQKNPLLLEWESRNTVFRNFQKVRESPLERAKFVRLFFTKWEELQTESYLTARSQYRAEWEKFILWLVPKLSPEQRKTAVDNLRVLSKQLQDLSVVEP